MKLSLLSSKTYFGEVVETDWKRCCYVSLFHVPPEEFENAAVFYFSELYYIDKPIRALYSFYVVLLSIVGYFYQSWVIFIKNGYTLYRVCAPDVIKFSNPKQKSH